MKTMPALGKALAVHSVALLLCIPSAMAAEWSPSGIARSPVLVTDTPVEKAAATIDRAAFRIARRLDMPTATAKSATLARPGMRVIGEGRLLSDAAQTDLDLTDLEWTADGNGGLRARLVVASAGAAYLRVGLRVSGLPSTFAARVVSMTGDSETTTVSPHVLRGAPGELAWTPPTEGDAQALEFSYAASERLARGAISVGGASHLFESPLATGMPHAKDLGDSLPCQVNVACVSESPSIDATTRTAFQNKVNSTALMVITTAGGQSGTCTGTLLNNDYSVAIFISAFHCVGTNSEANSLVTVWGFQAPTCNSTTFSTPAVRSGGAVIFNAIETQDSTLLGLRDTPPSSAILSGWDTAAVAAGTQMLGMHHPRGDVKKASVGTVTGISGAFSIGGVNYAASAFFTTGWQIGLVEPGSSGSGIFVQPSGATFLAFVGLLNSGPANQLSCAASTTYVNRYARFDQFFPSVRRYFRSDYSLNYTDLWWNQNESGWGVNVQHQGDTLFATWFTYDAAGNGLWLVLSDGVKLSTGVYQGALYRTTGTPFNLINGAQAFDLPLTQVGNATFSFSGNNAGTFSYTVNGIAGAKQIQRQRFSTATTCDFALASRTAITNYQDLWYNPNEPGWGVNIAHQGDTLFATWFTYDANRAGMWLVLSNGVRTAPGQYSGSLVRTTGTAFNLINGAPSVNQVTTVGTMSFRFIDGITADMTYTVNGITQTKRIQRQLFALPYSSCHA